MNFTCSYSGLLPLTWWMEGSCRARGLHGMEIWDFRRAFAIAARMSLFQTPTVNAHRVPQKSSAGCNTFNDFYYAIGLG